VTGPTTPATTRRRRSHGVIAGLAAVACVAAVSGASPTSANWVDAEYSAGVVVRTLACGTDAPVSITSRARMLDGDVLGQSLTPLVALQGIRVTDDGRTTVVDPADAAVSGTGWSAPLGVTALSTVTATASGTIALAPAASVGVVNQYAAASDGRGVAAAGAVGPTGAIDTGSGASGERPASATVDLGALVARISPAATDPLAQLTRGSLRVGALATRAELDGCPAIWAGTATPYVQRSYGIADLSARLGSPVLAAPLATVRSTATSVDAAVTAAGATSALATGVSTAVAGTLTSRLAGVATIGPATTTVSTASAAATAAAALGTQLGTGSSITVDLSTGDAAVDLTRILGDGTGSLGINGRPPNTRLRLTPSVLTGALDPEVAAWSTSAGTAVAAAIDAAAVTSTTTTRLDATLLGIPVTGVGTVTVTTGDALSRLRAGTGAVTARVDLLDCATLRVRINPTLPPSCATLDPVLTTLKSTVQGLLTPATGALGAAVAGAVDTAFTPVRALVDGTGGLRATLSTQGGQLAAFARDATTGLFGDGGLVVLAVNNQNRATSGGAEPPWAAALPAERASPYSSGVLEVTALRIAVGGAAGTLLGVDLARSSVGPALIASR
jgi:hypothetical protein